MNEELESRIRSRAYALWEKDASPEGNADHYWHIAARQLQAEGDAGERPPSPPQDQSAKHGRVGSAAESEAESREASSAVDTPYVSNKPGL